MKIAPKGAAPAPTPQPSSRDVAVAKLQSLMQGSTANKPIEAPINQSQEAPVLNPSQVSPEESAALLGSQEGQKSIIDDVSPEAAPKLASEEAPEEKKEETPLSSQFAVLARKEKALRAKVQQQDAAIKAKEAEISAREEAIRAKEAEYQSNSIPKDRLKQDPWTVLAELGVSYDDITQQALNPPQAIDPRVQATINKLEAEVKRLSGEQENGRKSFEDSQKQAYQQAVNQIRNDAKQLVNSNPDFETIKETGSVEDVVELIEKTFKDDGVLLTVEEAAKEIEDYLVEEATKLARIKKIQAKLNPPATAAPKQTEAQKQSQPAPTLTNRISTTRKLTAKERAMLAFKGELKS